MAKRYERVILKVSGESLAKPGELGIDPDELALLASEIADAYRNASPLQLAVVVGGGNIIRGARLAEAGTIDQSTADYMGMLGTVINALALQDVLEKKGLDTRVMTAIRMEELAEPYIRRRALRHFEKGRTVIFAGGTGNPYFSTDTAAVLRAIQMKADVIIKATSVDGIYSADPKKDPTATRYDAISYRDVMLGDLKVMDQTAITLCRENGLPIVVLNLHRPGAIARAIRGEPEGTLVS